MKDFIKDKITVKGNLFAGFTGGGVFSLFFLFLNIPLGASITASIVSYLAGLLIFAKANQQFDIKLSDVKIDDKRSGEILQEFRRKTNQLRIHSNSIRNSKIKAKVEDILSVLQKLDDNFIKDPSDIARARQFLVYYMDSTVKIVQFYIDLSAQNSNSKEVKDALTKGESILDLILHSFEVQHAKLLSNDVMDFNAEIEVLEKTLKMENME
ncbi:MAG TPA: 5-bromo-4-chloroindolyl phosphate hydrolysis family protein [Leptospiraceae bacterium]|nr:5-bromo-4-chloroindolyl phosphate hydrolysis family protein [Leptospiraceae bacterium]HMW07122.1 5-bromo-4-chloroindolyl phosphate hydrolysis family protein [Leptospiraceae bacterium]HMX31796.1 5-bromo-4-chloroindolyl phosphate hydrolysis family protein [Leptospiraceae bacterium]HMY32561.1 5-bromo-4-chloroindolyl phosphate hydrolysis family protein [Leptospiraceae bacterium]HMZ63905.1 5-bromo-4-chloroindolyl phosphate hydrolysis family protein [Leptospiraceae bacterium]